MDDEIQRAINELKEWAGKEYGSQSELARKLGVPRQRINDWFTGKKTPELKAWLKIQAFLRKERGRRQPSHKTKKADQASGGERVTIHQGRHPKALTLWD
jgi:DNA-binding XRE family transcriptional regulator